MGNFKKDTVVNDNIGAFRALIHEAKPEQRITVSRAASIIAVLEVLLLAGVVVMVLSLTTLRLAVQTSCGEGSDDIKYGNG